MASTIISSRKQRLSINAILFNEKGERLQSITRNVKASLLATLSASSFSKCLIKVTYPLGKDYYNDAYCYSYDEVEKFVKLFTEWELVKDMR